MSALTPSAPVPEFGRSRFRSAFLPLAPALEIGNLFPMTVEILENELKTLPELERARIHQRRPAATFTGFPKGN